MLWLGGRDSNPDSMVQSDGTIALGAGGAFGAVRYVSSLLYGVSASDGSTSLVTAFGLAFAAVLAS